MASGTLWLGLGAPVFQSSPQYVVAPGALVHWPEVTALKICNLSIATETCDPSYQKGQLGQKTKIWILILLQEHFLSYK